jgi:hypothetical protein
MRMRTALISMAAAAALLAGCGSGDETGGAPPAAAGGTAGTGGAGGSLGGAGGSVGGTGGAGGSVGGSGGSVGGAGGSVGGAAGAEAGPDVAEAGPDDAEAAAGAGGTSGAGGAGGTPFVDSCDGILDGSVIPPQKPLPYAVATDFKYVNNITPMTQINVLRWVNLGSPDCDMAFSDSSLPAPPPEFTTPPAEAGADDGAVEAADAAADADDAAADADDATADADDAAADAAADVSADAVADVSADAIADATADAAANPACWGFYYNPDNCANSSYVDSGAAPLWQCWGGVMYSLAPAGTTPASGVCIAAGATGIEFWARASRDGARIKFGSTREGLGLTEFWLNITTTWTKYTIDVAPDYRTPGVGYGVSNGFSAVVEPADHVGGTYIFVKDMKWVAAANDGG